MLDVVRNAARLLEGYPEVPRCQEIWGGTRTKVKPCLAEAWGVCWMFDVQDHLVSGLTD